MPALALLGGVAPYLLVTSPSAGATSTRSTRADSARRLILLALVPVAVELPALTSVAIVAALAWLLIVVEMRSYGELVAQLRHELASH